MLYCRLKHAIFCRARSTRLRAGPNRQDAHMQLKQIDAFCSLVAERRRSTRRRGSAIGLLRRHLSLCVPRPVSKDRVVCDISRQRRHELQLETTLGAATRASRNGVRSRRFSMMIHPWLFLRSAFCWPNWSRLDLIGLSNPEGIAAVCVSHDLNTDTQIRWQSMANYILQQPSGRSPAAAPA